MKSIGAVACLVLAAAGFCVSGGGCIAAKSSISEFNRMDVGGGPGPTLTRLTELQKQNQKKPGPPNTAPTAAPGNPATSPTMSSAPAPDPPGNPGSALAAAPSSNPPPPAQPVELASASPRTALDAPPPVYVTPVAAAQALPSPAGESGGDYGGGPRYRLGPEDKIRVSVWENKELSLDVVVRPDGKISVPLIQDVQAEGLTTTELADVIQAKLVDYIKDPHVSVIVLEVNASKFYVVGYVSKPGTYPLRGDVTVLQALSLAGGFTDFASPRKIRLVRKTGQKQEVRVINYYNMIDKGGEGNYLLVPGDTIVVP